MSLLLDVSRNRSETDDQPAGRYDPAAQVWDKVSDIKDVSEAIPIFLTGGTSYSGTTAQPPRDSDADDTPT